MYKDKELVIEILRQVNHALTVVLYRFRPVKEVSDFTDSPRGMEKLDSICMQLIAIGESTKSLIRLRAENFFLIIPGLTGRGLKE